jgi:hypothetical protein
MVPDDNCHGGRIEGRVIYDNIRKFIKYLQNVAKSG